jgi:hypothetical protein
MFDNGVSDNNIIGTTGLFQSKSGRTSASRLP